METIEHRCTRCGCIAMENSSDPVYCTRHPKLQQMRMGLEVGRSDSVLLKTAQLARTKS